MIGYKYYGRYIRPYLYVPEKKQYTILGMTLFSLVVFGAFAIRPSLATISKLQQEVKKAKEAQLLLEKKINDLSQAQINYQLASKDFDLVDEALPETTAVPKVLEKLSLAAARNNAVLRQITLGKTPNSDSVKVLPLTITVEGTAVGIGNFVTELERGTRQIDIEQVKISRGERETAEYLLAEIEGKTYFKK